MSKKLTYEFVKQSFESCGYTLISKEYINSGSRLNYECPKGHKHSIVWYAWKQGQRCPTCAGLAKPTIDHIRKSFSKENYVLLSEHYINNRSKLDYRCSEGHEHSIGWSNWQKGQRCSYCINNNIKLTIEQVRALFEKDNYILLSNIYINGKSKLDYQCLEGHNNSMIWNSWQQGIRCPTCADIEYSIKVSGSGNPQWKGGLSYEPYCPIWSDKEYKQYIRDRDGNKCLNPTCNKIDSRIHIHHIDYNKKSCNPNNIITLCGSCNSRANTDREWHTAWYQALMYRRYKYEYRKF